MIKIVVGLAVVVLALLSLAVPVLACEWDDRQHARKNPGPAHPAMNYQTVPRAGWYEISNHRVVEVVDPVQVYLLFVAATMPIAVMTDFQVFNRRHECRERSHTLRT